MTINLNVILRIIKNIAILIVLFIGLPIFAQKPTKIIFERAERLSYDREFGEIARAVGNAVFRHENSVLYCDSAYLFENTNNLEAFGKIKILVNDSVTLFGDFLKYNGDLKIAEIHNNVKMVDNQMTLTTDHLTYDMNKNIGTYYNGGKIINQNNILASRNGYYYTASKEFFFKRQVELTNPEYLMKSDTLKYNTVSQIAYFYGPSTIISKENEIYCENGWYNTSTNISQFNKNAVLTGKEHSIRGDSLYYDRTFGIGRAFKNVSIIDTVQNLLIFGHFAQMFEKEGVSSITDSALAVLVDKNDSLYIHADTFKLYFDSVKAGESLHAFWGTRFYRGDIQGVCDSLVYDFKDSTINLYLDPILWSGLSQLTADSILIRIEEDVVKSLILHSNGMIVQADKPGKYNQIKGKRMEGLFQENHLYMIKVKGNAETLYYVREDNGALIGVNKAESGELNIYIEDNKIVGLTFIQDPQARLSPLTELSESELNLKGFRWENIQRPVDKSDVFRKK